MNDAMAVRTTGRRRAAQGGLERRVRGLLLEGRRDAAVTDVIESLGGGVFGYLLSLLPEDDAHDAFSRFEEDLWRGLAGFRWECSLRAWAYRLASHAVARFHRDAYRRRREPLPSGSGLAPAAPLTSGPGGRRDELARLRDELAPDDRALLALRVGRELGWDEVSAALAGCGEEVSPVALRKRFERVKRRLVTLARERGLVR